MANLILTTDCQRNCSYCFAQKDKESKQSFTWENFIKAVGFLSTGPKLVNLLGGEPTLHKDFVKMLEYLITKDFRIQVFTNGMISDTVLKEVKDLLSSTALRKDQLFFGVNINEQKYRSEGEFEQQVKMFKTIGNYAYLSFTIHENTSLLFLQEIITEYGLDPTIRLGLAAPVIGGNNKFLNTDQYRDVAQNIIELANNSPGTTIKFDCGFPLCMFTLEEVNNLSGNEENEFSFTCAQPIDIYPDLQFTNCYPLSNLFKGRITNYKDFSTLVDNLANGFATATGIFKECDTCHFFNKICAGGCKGFYKPRENS